jgi:hypothetical protein
MKIKPLILLCFMTSCLSKVFGQINPGLEFSTRNQIEKLETSMGSTYVCETGFSIFSNPINKDEGSFESTASIYRRPASNFPLDLHIWYLFEGKAETASAIIFNWGLYNPSFHADQNIDLLVELSQKEREFVQQFDAIYVNLFNQFGKPEFIKDDVDEPHVLIKSYTWTTPDRFMTLGLSFSRELSNFPGIGYQANTFEIQVVLVKR